MFFFGTNKIESVSVNEAYNESKLKGNALIDVREISEYKSGHSEGSVNMPLSTLDEKDSEALKKFDNVYVICQSGGRSMRAVTFLKDKGVNAINISGGTLAWKVQNLPIK